MKCTENDNAGLLSSVTPKSQTLDEQLKSENTD